MEENRKVILILSGGMDSTTLAYDLVNQGYDVEALSFNYGQRHSKELESAMTTCLKLKIPHKVVDITSINQLLQGSALTSDIDVPEGHYADENMKATVVPNRNMIMISLAVGYAVSQEAKYVATAVHVGDHAIYPDCRKEFIEKLNEVTKIANYRPVELLTPYIDIDKGDIAIKGKELEVEYENSWTCYKGEEKPCGKCGACVERAEAFEKAEIKDPLL